MSLIENVINLQNNSQFETIQFILRHYNKSKILNYFNKTRAFLMFSAQQNNSFAEDVAAIKL